MNTLYQGKEARPKRTNVAGFFLRETPAVVTFTETQSGMVVVEGRGNGKLSV